ncbi:uncharacterized protein RHO17_005529 [Thomomys bottae]
MQSKQHRMEGEGQLFQTQGAIHSYKISSQLKKRQRKIHIRICLENVLKCQEKERAESKVLSQLQCEEEQEREFCHWRLDDKKTNAHCSSEQNKERQDNKEGNQQPCACDMELETLRNALIQLSEEQKEIKRELSKLAKDRRLETEISSNCLCLPKEIQMEQQKLNSELQEGKEEGCTEAVPKAKEMEDEMQKLVLQNFLLKATIEKKTKKIERLQQKLKRQRAKLASSPLTTDQINGTGGTNVFSKSSESVPEESTLPHYEQSKQHRMEGEGQLFQTQDAIHSYKISSQLKKRQRKIHIRICLENILKCQEKERAESKVLSQLQCEEAQAREFCHWRLDDKKTNAHCSSEQNKERQDNKEGNQQPCACDMELETLRNALIQLSEEQKEIKRELSKLAKDRRLETEISSNCLCLPKEIQMEQQKLNSELQEGKEEGCTEAVPKAKEMEDEMQKLVLQNFLLKATIEKKTKKIERLQQKLKRQRAKLPSSPLVNLFPKSTTLKRKTSFSIVRTFQVFLKQLISVEIFESFKMPMCGEN